MKTTDDATTASDRPMKTPSMISFLALLFTLMASAFLFLPSYAQNPETTRQTTKPAATKPASQPAPSNSPASKESSPEETTPPRFSLPEIGTTRLVEHEEAISLLSTHGSKLLVLNYWATWCAPCLAEMPYFQKAHETYKDRGVLFVGYSMDYDAYVEEAETATLGSLKRLGITYPSLILKVDSNVTFPHFSQEWAGNLPATFFFDEKGNKLGEFLGEVTGEELNAKIEELLKKVE
ncbi:MAG: TlpA disulfide reductase family protein [Candidatus Sumerlaeia bacterium]|nr:TlpA disulfide reductase family protein [Candidatus Sumerlaeia bacterium]